MANAVTGETGKTNNSLVLAGLLLGLIFAELDETVVATAMPTIIVDRKSLFSPWREDRLFI